MGYSRVTKKRSLSQESYEIQIPESSIHDADSTKLTRNEAFVYYIDYSKEKLINAEDVKNYTKRCIAHWQADII